MQKVLSVFIDESGDFGAYDKCCPYYLVTLLFHNQANPITADIAHLEHSLNEKRMLGHILHTGPLIRREGIYFPYRMEERKSILNSFMNFAAKIPVTYHTFIIKKQPDGNQFKLIAAISESIRQFLAGNAYFAEYNKIIVYYDNGQTQLTKIIASAFADSRTEFRRIEPSNYRLFQIADLVTTMELINQKRIDGDNSKTETEFFGSMRNFDKNYYKRLSKHKI